MNLQGDFALQSQIAGAIDLTHSARTEWREPLAHVTTSMTA